MNLSEKKIWEKFKARRSNGDVVRCMREENGTVFVFGKRKTRYGTRYTDEQFEKCYVIVEGADSALLWEKRVKKALECLNRSGLWPDYQTFFENLSKMSYKDREEMKKIDDRRYYTDPETGRYAKRTAAEMEVLWGDYPEKYPFAFGRDEDGNLFFKTDYIREKSDARLKTMYFGKHDNRYVKECISNALAEKRRYCSERYRTSYDVSFEYDPSRNMAWYSEEYKDCGNGYYYIALDANTALFIEKD